MGKHFERKSLLLPIYVGLWIVRGCDKSFRRISILLNHHVSRHVSSRALIYAFSQRTLKSDKVRSHPTTIYYDVNKVESRECSIKAASSDFRFAKLKEIFIQLLWQLAEIASDAVYIHMIICIINRVFNYAFIAIHCNGSLSSKTFA